VEGYERGPAVVALPSTLSTGWWWCRLQNLLTLSSFLPFLLLLYPRTAHKLVDDYVEAASNVALQSLGQFGPYGFDPDSSSYPVEAVSVLQFLKSPMRRSSALERWAPIEVALFEAALAEYGKDFHKVQREVKTKTTSEIVDFYYVWKKTPHYKLWKQQYVPPYLDHSEDDEDDNNNKSQGASSSKNGGGGKGKNGDRKPPAR
jgi:hypothetical protein